MKRIRHQDLTAPSRVLRPASNARPQISVTAVEGVEVVVKDFSVGASPFKLVMGRHLIARELAAYRNLAGLDGFPRCLGLLPPAGIVLEYVHATAAAESVGAADAPFYFERLYETVRQMHRAGVVHGDMRKLDNILVDEFGLPVLVDFAASFVTGSSPLAALLFPILADDDIRGIIKLKTVCAPELVSPEEAAFLRERPPVERFFRAWRDHVRKAVKRWSTR